MLGTNSIRDRFPLLDPLLFACCGPATAQNKVSEPILRFLLLLGAYFFHFALIVCYYTPSAGPAGSEGIYPLNESGYCGPILLLQLCV